MGSIFDNLDVPRLDTRGRCAQPKGTPPMIERQEKRVSKKKKDRYCLVCQKLLIGKKWNVRTCSRGCGELNRKLRTRGPGECRGCGETFWPKLNGGRWTTCCSRACRDKAYAPTFVDVTCAQCARVFKRRLDRHITRYRIHFCNIVCRGKYVRGENHALYRGDCDPNRGRRWVKLADSIRERDSYICQRCGKTQAENKQKLSVDHIRPWRSFDDKEDANRPENLVSLCRPCHSTKTTTIEGQWLKGDVLAMQQYERSVRLPPLFAQPITKQTISDKDGRIRQGAK